MHGLKLRKTSILHVIEESLEKLAHRNRVTVELKSSLEDEAVWIDCEQMAGVFLDLERNAMEAMPGGGSLIITARGDERQVTVILADTGAGIAEENIPLLFTPFFTTKPIGDGTGLGLPSAYAAVKAHRGDMTIESNADPKKGPTGTTVRIMLPRSQVYQKEQSKIILHEEE